MRRVCTSILLMTAILAVAPYCVAGGGGSCANAGTADHCQPHHRQSATLNAQPCTVRASADSRCGFRTFVHFHALQLRSVTSSAPLLIVNRRLALTTPNIIVSSVGPPETDRGPPRS